MDRDRLVFEGNIVSEVHDLFNIERKNFDQTSIITISLKNKQNDDNNVVYITQGTLDLEFLDKYCSENNFFKMLFCCEEGKFIIFPNKTYFCFVKNFFYNSEKCSMNKFFSHVSNPLRNEAVAKNNERISEFVAVKNATGKTPLFFSSFLLFNHFDMYVNELDDEGTSILLFYLNYVYNCDKGCLNIFNSIDFTSSCEILPNAGVDIGILDKQNGNEKILHKIISLRNIKIMKMLIAKKNHSLVKAEKFYKILDQSTCNGETPLDYVIKKKSNKFYNNKQKALLEEIYSLLQEQGALSYKDVKTYKTPLRFYAANNDLIMLRKLLKIPYYRRLIKIKDVYRKTVMGYIRKELRMAKKKNKNTDELINLLSFLTITEDSIDSKKFIIKEQDVLSDGDIEAYRIPLNFYAVLNDFALVQQLLKIQQYRELTEIHDFFEKTVFDYLFSSLNAQQNNRVMNINN